jgi:intein/homing endonuclease
MDMVCEYDYDENTMKIRVRCLGCLYGSSIEDFPMCMAATINKLLETKKVTSVVLVRDREYEYDYEQVKMLLEIAKIVEDVSRGDIPISSLPKADLSKCYPEWETKLNYIVYDLLPKDPIGAYVKIKRELRRIDVKQKKLQSEIYTSALKEYKHVLQILMARLGNTKLLKLARPDTFGYHIGNRDLYRQIFMPSVRPNFMFTRYLITPPKNAESVDRYKVGDAQVEIFRIPKSTQNLYFVLPPEFKLSEEKYMVLDSARTYMAAHKPTTEEFVKSQRIREIFFNIGKDVIRDMAGRMGLRLSGKEINQLSTTLTRYTAGYGVLEILLADERIQDLYINSPIESQPILVFHQDWEECKTNLIPTQEDAEAWATRLRIQSGRPLDEANPVLDVDIAVPGGRARFAVITNTLSPKGLGFAIRRHRFKPWTLPLFIKAKMFTPLAAGLLSFLIDGSASVLVAGGRSSGKCLKGSELVRLSSGELKTIKSIVEDAFKKNKVLRCDDGFYAFADDVEIMTMDSNLKIKPAKVSCVWKREAGDSNVRVKLRSGRSITSTPEHPFFVLNGLDIAEKRADEIRPLDRIAVARTCVTVPKDVKLPGFEQTLGKNIKIPELSPELLELLGYIYGDGHIRAKGSKCVGFTNNNPLLQKRFKNLVSELFGLENVKRVVDKRNGVVSSLVHSSSLVKFLNENLKVPEGRKAAILSIPNFILSLPNKHLSSFLRAVFDCDSHVTKGARVIEFSTASKTFAAQIQSLLTRFGVISFVKEKIVRNKPYYRVVISGPEITKFMNSIGFNHPEKRKRCIDIIQKTKFDNTNIDTVPISGERIRHVRNLLGIQNGRELRGRIKSNILNIEKGKWLLSRKRIKQISEIFQNRYNEIMEYSDVVDDGKSALKFIKNIRHLTRCAYYLARMCGLSYEEIAEHCNSSRDNTRRYLKAERNRLNPDVVLKILKSVAKLSEERIGGIRKLIELETDVKNLPHYIDYSPFSYEDFSKSSHIPTTCVKSYAYQGIEPPFVRGIKLKESMMNVKDFYRNSYNSVLRALSKLESLPDVDLEHLWVKLCEFFRLISLKDREISRHTGLSVTAISNYRNGKNLPSIESLKRVLEYAIEKFDLIVSNGDEIKMIGFLADSDIFWDEVVSVENIKPKEKWVYDLTVDKTHNFIANGIVAHNTSVLSALMLELLPKTRQIVIEDTLELPVEELTKLGYNIESLKSRSVITRVETEMPADEALRTSLRLGDSAMIVGEIRSSIRGSEEVVIIENGETKRVPIKDLERKSLKNIYVPTLDRKHKVKLTKLTDFVKHPSRKRLLEITTKTGRKVTVTEDHSVFTATNFKVHPIETNKLKPGDKILIPASMPSGYNDVDCLDLTELLPDLRLHGAEKYIRKAIKKLGWRKASKICNVRDIYVYVSWGKYKSRIPVKAFKKLMKESGISYSLNDLRIKNVTSNTLPAKLKVGKDFCRFLGYYAAEGYCSDTHGVIITNSNKKIMEDVISISKRLFNISPKIREVSGLGKSKQIRISSSPLKNLVLKLGCGRICGEKRIPPIIYGLSEGKICSFLKGLYSGGFSTGSKNSGNVVRYATTSEKLAEDVMYLLLTLGIVARVYKKCPNLRGRKVLYSVEFKQREFVKTFLEKVGFTHKKPVLIKKSVPHTTDNSIHFDVDELEKHIKLPRKYRHLRRYCQCSKNYLQKLSEEAECSRQFSDFVNGDFYMDEIKAIDEIELETPEPVYDLSVNPTENFIGGFGGIVLHNTEAKALWEAMRIGALSNVVAGTIHGESAYGVFDRVVNDLGVPLASFKATDVIPICKMLRSADGLHRYRRLTEITEVRKKWSKDPIKEGAFVNLMEYSGKEDVLKPSDTLVNGESEVLNRIASFVREWSGNWEAVWENIKLRGKIKQIMVDYAEKLNKPELMEAHWVSRSNAQFHLIEELVRSEVGRSDAKRVYAQWLDWFKAVVK